MKKILIILVLVFFAVSCATISERYTEKRIQVTPQEYEEYSSTGPSSYYYSYGYSPYYYSPFYWVGFYWWNPYSFWDPFFYYGFYDFYYGYYPRYYRGYYYPGYYPGYWGTRYGRSVIWKNQLKKGTLKTIPKSTIKKTSGKVGSAGRIRSTVSRSGFSARSPVRTSSRVSTTKIKKK